MAEDDYPFDSLTREMVISQLAAVENAAEEAADIVAATIVAGIKSTEAARAPQTARHSVRLVVKGMIEGLSALDRNPGEGAAAVLRRLGETARACGQDEDVMLTWVLDGIADGIALLDDGRAAEVESAVAHAGLEPARRLQALRRRS